MICIYKFYFILKNDTNIPRVMGILLSDDDCILIMWRKPMEVIYEMLCHMYHTHVHRLSTSEY